MAELMFTETIAYWQRLVAVISEAEIKTRRDRMKESILLDPECLLDPASCRRRRAIVDAHETALKMTKHWRDSGTLEANRERLLHAVRAAEREANEHFLLQQSPERRAQIETMRDRIVAAEDRQRVMSKRLDPLLDRLEAVEQRAALANFLNCLGSSDEVQQKRAETLWEKAGLASRSLEDAHAFIAGWEQAKGPGRGTNPPKPRGSTVNSLYRVWELVCDGQPIARAARIAAEEEGKRDTQLNDHAEYLAKEFRKRMREASKIVEANILPSPT